MSKNSKNVAEQTADAVLSQSETTEQKPELAPADSPAAPVDAVAESAAQPPEKPAKTVEQLEQELAAANATITELIKKREEADHFELAVREKMKAGLTRDQSIAVLHRQRDWDNSDLGRMQNARHARRQAGN